MKTLTFLFALCMLALTVFAEPLTYVRLKLTGLTTVPTTNDWPAAISGEIREVVVKISGNQGNPTCDVSVVTTTAGDFGVAKNVLVLSGITASDVYPVRIPTVDTNGAAQVNFDVITLMHDYLRLIGSSANVTNNVDVYVGIDSK